jgi:hypothetical protein
MNFEALEKWLIDEPAMVGPALALRAANYDDSALNSAD